MSDCSDRATLDFLLAQPGEECSLPPAGVPKMSPSRVAGRSESSVSSSLP
jgi:hypothetical protein